MKAVFVVVLITFGIGCAVGQGLKRPTGQLRASNDGARALEQAYKKQFANSLNVAKNYKSQSAAEKSRCVGGKEKAALCASNLGSGSSSDDAALLALGPMEWNWAKAPGDRGGDVMATVNPFGPTRDQGSCGTCVSFAFIAAAEAAVARTLGLSGGSVRMSVQDHGFCPVREDDTRFCTDGMTMQEAITKLRSQQLVSEDCLPYQVDTLGDNTKKCTYQCSRPGPDPKAQNGRFDVVQIPSIPAAQRHIRRWGGVVTSISIYSDFRPFFASNPSGVYEGKACDGSSGAALVDNHAVVLVGYNNKDNYWVARNSWGRGFADGGYFKIRYGVCGVASPNEVYGVKWIPSGGVRIPVAVSKDAQQPGCYIYRAKPGDSISGLADAWGVDAFELLYNNSASIDDISKPLDGIVLRVCGITNNNVDLKTPDWA